MSLACTIHAALDLRLTEETPRALGATDVLLRLGAGGICGSDLHYYKEGRVGAFVVARAARCRATRPRAWSTPWAARSRA